MNPQSIFAGNGELEALLQTTTTWLAVLAVLTGLAFWWQKRRRGSPSAVGARLRRVATLRLGPRAVHLVVVDGQRVLVSDTAIAVLDGAVTAEHNAELAAAEAAVAVPDTTRRQLFGDER